LLSGRTPKMIRKIFTYVVLAMCLFLAFQWGLAWIKGQEWSSVQSIYRIKHKPIQIAPEAPRKGEKVVTQACVPLEVIVPSKGQLEPQGSPYITGRWHIPASNHGGEAVTTVDKDGKSGLTFTAKDGGLFDIGRSRYATLWADYSLNSDSEKRMSLKLDLELDAFRVGPLWTRVHGGIYYSQTTLSDNEKINDVGVYVGAGLGVGF
jgi:hypothetical protein